MQSGVIAQAAFGRQSRFKPVMGGLVDEVALFEQGSVGLITRLFGIASVNKQSGATLQHKGQPP